MHYKDFCESTARKAGEIMKKYFYATDHISYKGGAEVVTIADQMINQLVIDEVAKQFPEHDVIGEEADGTATGGRFIRITDPIDGTVEYAHRIPLSVFSLALLDDGQPIVGCVYQPFLDELYYAEKGKGAFCNGQKLSVSTRGFNEIGSLMGYSMGRSSPFNLRPFRDEVRQQQKYIKMRNIGPITYMGVLVATGSMDAIVFPSIKPYDIAAVKVLVEEAGGKESDLFGNQQRFDGPIKGNIVSNGLIHNEIAQMLAKYDLSL